MKTYFAFIFLTFFSFSCQNKNNTETATEPIAKPLAYTGLAKAYDDSLRRLPFSLQSSTRGLDLFTNHFKSDTLVKNDWCLKSYLTFQATLIDSLNAALERNPDYDSIGTLIWADASLHAEAGLAFERKLKDHGLQLSSTEGIIFIDRQTNPIRNTFFDYVTPATQQFFNQFERETNERFWDDGAIVISESALADRLVYWDDFRVKFPNHLFSEYVTDQRATYLYSLLVGGDNTPAFDYDTREMYPEFRKALRFVMDKYPDLPVTKVIHEYNALLEKNGFKETDEVKTFTEKLRPW